MPPGSPNDGPQPARDRRSRRRRAAAITAVAVATAGLALAPTLVGTIDQSPRSSLIGVGPPLVVGLLVIMAIIWRGPVADDEPADAESPPSVAPPAPRDRSIPSEPPIPVESRRGFFAGAAALAAAGEATHCIIVVSSAGDAGDPDAPAAEQAGLVAPLAPGSIVGRLAHGQLAVILPEADCDTGVAVCERMRSSIASAGIGDVSFGLTDWSTTDESIDEALSRGDHALYRACQRGRGRIEVSPRGTGTKPPSSDLAPSARRR